VASVPSSANRELFSSRWGFALAAMGGAVGLGNIWRFTFIAGENGGGAFIFLYFVFIILFGVPGLIAMIMIGRRGGRSPVGSTRVLAMAEGRSENWKYLGWTTLSVAFFALTFFSVIAGFVLAYLLKSSLGVFSGITPQESIQLFGEVQNGVAAMVGWHTVFMLLTMFIVVRGIRSGIERTVTFMMPTLFLILVILVVYSAITADFAAALRFMFVPDFSAINPEVVILALGQAFFSLSVGGGGIIAYGAYLQKSASIPHTALAIAAANVSVDMLAGLAIFPIVFAYGLAPGSGPGLMFETLPVAFGQMPWGGFFGTLFLLMVLFAALSTSISMLQSVVSRLVEREGASRTKMTIAAGGAAWIIGLGSVFSFNIWSEFKPLTFIDLLQDATIFRIIDFFVVNNLILVSAFFLLIFAGWVMSEEATRDEFGMGDGVVYRSWRFIMCYLAPTAMAVIAIANIFGS